jgi:hypothetical protein
MKFDVYGRFRLDIVRVDGGWVAYRLQDGSRTRDDSIAIPATLRPDELVGYLDDLYHELGSPGRSIRALP